jgi:tetratricopeptide (TPR) repeat protein
MKTSVQKANLAYQKKRYRTALRHYRLIPENEWDKSIMLNVAYCQNMLRLYTAAESSCRRVLKNFPDNVEAHVILVKILLNGGMFDQAEREIRALKLLSNEEPIIYVGTAHMKLFQNDIDQATDLIKEALLLDPEYDHAHHIMGYMYEVKNEYKKALDEYRKAFKLKRSFMNFRHIFRILHRKYYWLINFTQLGAGVFLVNTNFSWLFFVFFLWNCFVVYVRFSYKEYLAAGFNLLMAVAFLTFALHN